MITVLNISVIDSSTLFFSFFCHDDYRKKNTSNAGYISLKFNFTCSLDRNSKLVQVNDLLPGNQAHVTYQLMLEEMSPDI